MKITFIGAAQTTTGSKSLLQTSKERILVDCGLFQGYKEGRLKNWEPFPVTPSTIDKVVLTHAHIDHTGYLPLLVKQGFKGPVLATAATSALAEILLCDAGRIQEEDAKRANRLGYSKHKPALPLFTEEDAKKALKQFKTIPFGEPISLDSELTLQTARSGHILGSSFLTFRENGRSIVFSGDLGRKSSFLLQSPAIIQSADWLVLESTYGSRLHPVEDPIEKLGSIIEKTVKRGGTVVIPSFAVARAQTILYLLYKLKEMGRIKNIPIYLDSPMAQDATDMLNEFHNEHKLTRDMCKKVCSVAHYVQSAEESKSLNQTPMPKIIIAASGMVEGGRVLHHVKFYGPDHHNTIVFSGYQAGGTRGDRILRGEKEVKIFGAMVPIRAQIEAIESLSSHADYQETIDWLKNFTSPPRAVFLNHGELEASLSLKEKIEKELKWKVYVPSPMEEFDL